MKNAKEAKALKAELKELLVKKERWNALAPDIYENGNYEQIERMQHSVRELNKEICDVESLISFYS